MAVCLAATRRKFAASVTPALLVAFCWSVGCSKKQDDAVTAPSASAAASVAPKALTPEQAARVLAKVGDRSITLGEYAASLERMDTFERLRYQSPERRRLLLNEMIDLELLAQEARRRGLDKQPETQERLRQMLRDELLKDVRREAKGADAISEAEVRKYYDEHREEFNDPERRRVSHIAVASQSEGKALLAKAQAIVATPTAGAEWGKLVAENSLDKGSRAVGSMPPELLGDLGIVGPPGHPRGGNPRVPEALRAAVFKIGAEGGVLPELVSDAGQYHIVRFTSRSSARERSYAEAERSIRVTLAQEQMKAREVAFERELRAKFPVTIDEAGLAKTVLPKPATSSGAKPKSP